MQISLTDHEFHNSGVVEALPDGCRILVCHEDEFQSASREYFVVEGKAELTTDYDELQREFNEEELEQFESSITSLDQVIDYFLSRDESDRTPYREYRIYSQQLRNRTNGLISSSGYRTLNEGKEDEIQFNVLSVKASESSSYEEYHDLVKLIVDSYKHHYPDVSEYYLDIYEPTLSEYGIHSVSWAPGGHFEHNFCRFGHTEVERTFSSLSDMTRYFYDNHRFGLDD